MLGPTGLGMLIWLRNECVCCGGMAADWSLVTESRGGVGCGDLVLKALLVNATTIEATVPAETVGVVNVRIKTAGGNSAFIRNDKYIYKWA